MKFNPVHTNSGDEPGATNFRCPTVDGVQSMGSLNQIDYAIKYGKRLRKFVREIELPRFKRVRVGRVYKATALTYFRLALSELEMLKKHLEEQ